MTLIALDLGTKKVGVAVSHGFVADSFGTLSYDEKKPADFISKLKEIVMSQGAEILIVGLPMGREGKPTKQGEWIKKNARRIARALVLPLEFTEESFSSVSAKQNLGSKSTKEKIDAESARIILNQYLNEQSNSSL